MVRRLPCKPAVDTEGAARVRDEDNDEAEKERLVLAWLPRNLPERQQVVSDQQESTDSGESCAGAEEQGHTDGHLAEGDGPTEERDVRQYDAHKEWSVEAVAAVHIGVQEMRHVLRPGRPP